MMLAAGLTLLAITTSVAAQSTSAFEETVVSIATQGSSIATETVVYTTNILLPTATQSPLDNSLTATLTTILSPTTQGSTCYGPTVITEPAGLTALEGCATYSGNITIASVTADSQPSATPAYLQLNGVRAITGSLIFHDNAASDVDGLTIQAPELESVSGAVIFANMTNMNMPEFVSLRSAESIWFQDLEFQTGIPSFGPTSWPSLRSLALLVVANTGISELGGWTWPIASMQHSSKIASNPEEPMLAISATGNSLLHSISFSGWPNVSTTILAQIGDNNDALNVELPDFTDSALRIRGVATFSARDVITLFDGFATLQNLLWGAGVRPTGLPNLGFTENSFDTLDLFSLETMNDTVYIESNPSLYRLELPSLERVDELLLWNNQNLNYIFFRSLTTIGSLLKIVGSFLSLQFPALQEGSTTGGLYIISQGEYSCSALDQAQRRTHFIEGKYTCIRPGYDGGLSQDAKIAIGVGVGVGVPLLVAAFALAWICLRRRRRARRGQSPRQRLSSEDGTPPPDYHQELATDTEVKELPPSDGHELPTGKLAQELPASHGFAELDEKAYGKPPVELDSQSPISVGWPPEKL